MRKLWVQELHLQHEVGGDRGFGDEAHAAGLEQLSVGTYIT